MDMDSFEEQVGVARPLASLYNVLDSVPRPARVGGVKGTLDFQSGDGVGGGCFPHLQLPSLSKAHVLSMEIELEQAGRCRGREQASRAPKAWGTVT